MQWYAFITLRGLKDKLLGSLPRAGNLKFMQIRGQHPAHQKQAPGIPPKHLM